MKVCSFRINGRKYDIYNVEKISGKNTYIGRSNYDDRTIYIEKSNLKDMLLTLKHELMHVWLYENGFANQQDGCFSFEEVCELVAYSNNSINRIVELYLKELTN